MLRKTAFFSFSLFLVFSAASLAADDTLERAEVHTPWSGYGDYGWESFKSLEEANSSIDFGDIDYALLQAAVLYETNRIRQKFGKPLFIHSDSLERSAMMHAMDMAEDGFFSHNNPRDSRKRRFTDRTALFSSRGAAENIATTFGIQYTAGTSVSSISDIPPHTYNSFAEALVDSWMNSPGHRANILDSKGYEYHYLGCGVCPIPGDRWHKFYAVQNFGYSVSE